MFISRDAALCAALMTAVYAGFAAVPAPGQISVLLAKGTLTGSSAGPNADLLGLTNTLENGVPANLLGGLGSGLAHLSGDSFLAVPDRGPNAVPFNPLVDDTVSYINRFQTVKMHLRHQVGGDLPFSISPELKATTLLHSSINLAYGTGDGLNIGSGKPGQDGPELNYFTGRSDGFDPDHSSGSSFNQRLDPESIRVSNDGLSVFISDEYGPHIYQFQRSNGRRLHSFRIPKDFYVLNSAPAGSAEISGNTSGRVANKGMEGLAITPDGRTLVGIMQNALIQDAAEGGAATSLLRIVTIDIASSKATHQYAYLLTSGTGVSEIVALNNHEFLVDERDGKGLGDGSKAKVKQLFKIDLRGATDVTGLNGTQAAAKAVTKTLTLDLVQVLGSYGVKPEEIPAKIEGLAFGPDVNYNGSRVHTLWIANDNDFLQDYSGPGTNPNQFFVFGFTDANLSGSHYVPQRHTSAF